MSLYLLQYCLTLENLYTYSILEVLLENVGDWGCLDLYLCIYAGCMLLTSTTCTQQKCTDTSQGWLEAASKNVLTCTNKLEKIL